MASIYNVSVAFNVKAESQTEAHQKMADYLWKMSPLIGFEEIEEPIKQPFITEEDCETLIQ